MKKNIYLSVAAVALVIAGVAVWALCRGEKEKYEGVPVAETPLQEFVRLPEDSTCLLFVFIPSCKYCQNSVTNLNDYPKAGVADRVIGLTLNDSVGIRHFIEDYKPAFRVVGCDALKLLEFNNRFPTSYYIENNIIVKIFRGELPEGRKFFKKSKSKTNKQQC